MVEKPSPRFVDIKKFLLKAAIIAPMVLPGVGHAEPNPEADSDTEQLTADTTISSQTAEPAFMAITPDQTAIAQGTAAPEPLVQAPNAEAPKPYQEVALFAMSSPKFSPKEWAAMDDYTKPFDAAKIGVTTSAEVAVNLDPKTTKTTKKDGFTIIELPLPATSAQELKRTYKEEARTNKIVFGPDGKVFMKRVVGLVPPSNKQVGLADYLAFLKRPAEETTQGNIAWGEHTQNEFYLPEGLILVDSPDNLVYEFVLYNPIKADGSTMSKAEIVQVYSSLFSPEFNYINPNSK